MTLDIPAAFIEPATPLGEDEAESAVAVLFGISGKARRLSGEKDLNFHLLGARGDEYLLKVSHPAEQGEAVDCQNAAMLHVARADPELPTPRPRCALDGSLAPRLTRSNGASRIVRLFDWLPGTPLHAAPRSTEQSSVLGGTLARLGKALRHFKHPNDRPFLIWDIAHTCKLRFFLPSVPDQRRRRVEQALDRFERDALPLLPTMRAQVVHNDLNPYNVLVGPRHSACVTGILDFGDLVRTALINDVAVGASYHVHEESELSVSAFVDGYCSVVRLEKRELDILPTLIAARLAATLLITHWRAELHPENRDYILRNNESAWQGLRDF